MHRADLHRPVFVIDHLHDEVLRRPIESTQYAGVAYHALLAAHGIVPSMSGTGNCYDNAVVESLFSTLEFEVLRQQTWATPGEAREGVGRYIEQWYNPRRRHSTLGYRSPMEFEAQVLQAA